MKEEDFNEDFIAEIHLEDWEEEGNFFVKGRMKIDVDNNLFIEETYIKKIEKYVDLIALDYVVNEEYNSDSEQNYLVTEFCDYFGEDKPSFIVFNKYHNDIFTYNGHIGQGEWDDFLLQRKWSNDEVDIINIDAYPSIVTKNGLENLVEKTLGESIADHRDAVVEDINI